MTQYFLIIPKIIYGTINYSYHGLLFLFFFKSAVNSFFYEFINFSKNKKIIFFNSTLMFSMIFNHCRQN